MDPELRRRLDAVIALLVLTTAGVLGLALEQGAFGAAAAVFLVGALVSQFALSVGLFPASDDSKT